MDIDTWKWTSLDSIPSALGSDLVLSPEELPTVGCFLGSSNWYVMTTSRVVGHNDLGPFEFDPRAAVSWHWGDFKGLGFVELEVLKVTLGDEHYVELTYETGKAAMAPIYYERFWAIKYPVLDRLAV
jgi:hypothetical protein